MEKIVKKLLLGVLFLLCSNSAMAIGREYHTVIDGICYELYVTDLSYSVQANNSWGTTPENVNILAEVYFDIDDDDNGIHIHENVPVTEVKFENWDESKNIKTIFLPSTIESFGLFLSGLESVTVDNANPYYKSVDGSVYSKNMSTLLYVPPMKDKLVIPNGVERIGTGKNAVFGSLGTDIIPQCSMISIPETVKTISDYAFYSCSNLRSIVIPNSVETIGNYAFWGNKALNEISLSTSLKSIGRLCFEWCNIENITLPRNLSYFSVSAFNNCENLKAINVDKENLWYRSIDGVVFNKSLSELVCYPWGSSESYTVPNGVVKIGEYAFYRRKSLKNIVLPEGLDTIGSGAFYECRGLLNITFPNSLKEIGKAALFECPLYRLTLPKNLKKIGDYALTNVKILKSLAVNPPELGFRAFYDPKKVIVPSGSLSAYKSANNWKTLNISSFAIIRRNITISPRYVFQNEVDNVDESVTWSSSDESIAYVNESNLVVSMGKVGKCTLYLKSGEETDSCVVEIPEAAEISNINRAAENEPTSIVIDGISADRSMLNVHLEPVGATTQLEWSSSDESIATIDCGLIDFKRDAPVTFSVESSSGEISEFLYQNSGVETITDDSMIDEPIEYYNLQGMRVNNPTNGIYIRRQGDDVIKIRL